MRKASRRFWPCIAAAVAVGVIAAPAASAGVHRYSTELTMVAEQDDTSWFGWVRSEIHKCERDRFVTLFKQQPGADRKLGVRRSRAYSGDAVWGWHTRAGQVDRGDRVYAEVERKVGKGGDVCRADRSKTLTADD
jgi:hypothetical protein